MILDRFVPDFAFSERHSIQVRASRSRIFESLDQLTPAHVPIARMLMNIRGLRTDIGTPFLQQCATLGFVLLEKKPESEIVLGLVGQFWKPTGGICLEVKTPADFLRFDTPKYTKVGWNFFVEDSEGGCVLRTETRIQPTDPSARLRFRLYWLLVRPGSGLIRRSILRATKHLAESNR